jgi:HEPN domain-containing protein
MKFVRDGSHWLYRFSPDEWLRAAMGELRRAESAYKRSDARGGLAGLRRAAGMALNGALIVKPDPSWGRSYVDHVRALERDETAPEAVRKAAALLMDAQPPGSPLVMLRAPRTEVRLVEAARDVVAHAYALVKRVDVIEDAPESGTRTAEKEGERS